jgi:AcrR family transcriptional regulator
MEAIARGRPRSAAADEKILTVALEQLRERGYSALSMEQVAAEAGVGKATLYRRYRNKADLATAALASRKAAAYDAPLPDDARAALVLHLKRVERNITEMRFAVLGPLFEANADPELLELHRERVVRRGHRRFVEILERAQERGEVRGDADLTSAIEMLVGALLARHVTGADRPRWAESLVDVLLRGIAPR